MTVKRPLLEQLFSLEGKAALITGSSSGIGQGLAFGLAEAGAVVGVHGRDQERVTQTCSMIEEAGGKAAGLITDIREVGDCRKLIADAHEAMGRLDILINSAATNRRKPIADVTEEDFDTITAVNLRSIYFLSQAAHSIMCSQGGGKIIHIGSINIFHAFDTVSVYGLTKGGMAQVTKVMAVEWADDNIQVNCISPGFFRTPLTEVLWADEKKARWLRGHIPVRRGGDPRELLGTAILLASDASSYITGENIVVDGGFMAGGSWNRDET